MQLLIDKPRGEEGGERRGRNGGRQHLLYAIQFIFAWLFDHIHSLVGLHCPLLLLLLMSFFFFERYQTKLRNFIRYAPLTLNAISARLAQIHTRMSIQQQGVSNCVRVCVGVWFCSRVLFGLHFFKAPSLCICFAVLLRKQAKAPTYWTSPGSQTWTQKLSTRTQTRTQTRARLNQSTAAGGNSAMAFQYLPNVRMDKVPALCVEKLDENQSAIALINIYVRWRVC